MFTKLHDRRNPTAHLCHTTQCCYRRAAGTLAWIFANFSFTFHVITHTHTTVLRPSWILSGSTRVSRHQKGKTNLDLLEQEIMSGSVISWAICKSAPWPRHITMPTPNQSVFLQAGCPSCHQTNSIKAHNQLLTIHKYNGNRNISMITSKIYSPNFTKIHILS